MRPRFWHEMRTGLLLGLGWRQCYSCIDLGFTPALAVTVSLAIARSSVGHALGSLLPLLAQRLRSTPAIVSGPVPDHGCDATGLFSYFFLSPNRPGCRDRSQASEAVSVHHRCRSILRHAAVVWIVQVDVPVDQ